MKYFVQVQGGMYILQALESTFADQTLPCGEEQVQAHTFVKYIVLEVQDQRSKAKSLVTQVKHCCEIFCTSAGGHVHCKSSRVNFCRPNTSMW